MQLNEIRSKYLEFFEARGHKILPSASLVPENDPTTLFTGSGMQPLVPYLLGKDHPEGKRLANSQKCFRAMDIEEVGDNRHTTFFEMLGNWSLGDYFKEEQLQFAFYFFTKEVGIPKEKLWVTCFAGDEALGLPKDTESYEIWQKLGIPESHIRYYGAEKNWWSRAGQPANMPAGEPGGPDSEVFYEFTQVEHDKKFGEECHPNCDCGRFLEIGNSVFMQYLKQEGDSFGQLPKQNVDFGGGLERIAAVSQGTNDIFLADIFDEARNAIEVATDKKYSENPKEFRIILDHIRAAVFLLADGVIPSNTERGYVLRRLLRRTVRFADKLCAKDLVVTSPDIMLQRSLIVDVAETFNKIYDSTYGLTAHANQIIITIKKEEENFRNTLARGLKEFVRFAGDGEISAQDAFQLVTTYGFPLELIVEEAGERGIKNIDTEGFKELLTQHQEKSRAGAQQKFKGGLADTSEQTVRLHTAHHLLLKALQLVLGPEVHQRGSNITAERLRIDFNYPQKVSKEQLAEIEKTVNEKIAEDLPVVRTEMAKEEAEKLGAEHEFGAKYPERVSVYSVGPLTSAFSIEFCGGPHVEHTGQLSEGGPDGRSKKFKIQKEEAVAQGIRRIKAVLE